MRCKYEEPCDCGREMLCNHPENEDCICDKESCPKKKYRKSKTNR
jgi:hypothetical protein